MGPRPTKIGASAPGSRVLILVSRVLILVRTLCGRFDLRSDVRDQGTRVLILVEIVRKATDKLRSGVQLQGLRVLDLMVAAAPDRRFHQFRARGAQSSLKCFAPRVIHGHYPPQGDESLIT